VGFLIADTEDLGEPSSYEAYLVLGERAILDVPVENPTWRDDSRVERSWDCCEDA